MTSFRNRADNVKNLVKQDRPQMEIKYGARVLHAG